MIAEAIFDDQSANWSSDPDINKIFLRTINNFALDRLKARGHLFLNDVHDMLGLPRTSQGQLIGWLKRDSVTLWEEQEEENFVRLTFLTQGEIYDKIELKES